jgi:uncharacterized iron-regulated membrane protein
MRRSLRIWMAVHKWTSLVCTVFLLLLCLTGLPLIFHHEIDDLLGDAAVPAAVAPGTPDADLDRVVAAGLAATPGEVLRYIVWDDEEPALVHLVIAPTADAPDAANRVVVVDARTAEALGPPVGGDTLMGFIFRLHVDMFAGLPGKLFLGLMGLLFVTAIVSGVVVYRPFMRRLDFGAVRQGRSRRLYWLDLHNLLGIVTVAWVLVVGVTGSINTLADIVLAVWQRDQLAEMVAPYAGQPKPETLSPVQAAVAVAEEATPQMKRAFLAMPGTAFTSAHHYGVFMRGVSPLTSRLVKPVLVDAETGELTDTRDMPWYVTALLVSQPLHFGDYGGMPLKIIWAVLDLITIIVLGSGLYLWLARKTRVAPLPHAAAEAAE